jgi:predicted O-methyltransferase YrrM
MRALFALATFLGAALLFLVQPIVARMALPLLGGSPAVWSTCMVFFQAVLLAGYAYAHLLERRLRPRVQSSVHVAVLAAGLIFLPIHLSEVFGPSPHGAPVLWLLGTLAASIGFPFFALATTGPLVQRWFHLSGHPEGRDPYSLYAVGNLGSLAALLAYPLVVEPSLGLSAPCSSWFPPRMACLSQKMLFSAGYVVFAVLMATSAVLVWKRAPATRQSDETATPSAAVPWRSRLVWVLLAFVPSSALLAVTQYLSTDIAVFPLLWVLPLAVYLMTFILAFSRRSWLPPASWSAGLAVAAVAVVASFWVFFRPYPLVLFVLHPLTLFFLGMVCHGRLAALRPAPGRLTEFYFWIALGGVLGGAFNTLAAPLLFRSIAEYPIVLLAACLCRPGALKRPRVLDFALPAALALAATAMPLVVSHGKIESTGGVLAVQVGIPCALALLLTGRPLRFALGIAVLLIVAQSQTRLSGEVLYAKRDFFGVHRVVRVGGPIYHGFDAEGRPTSLDWTLNVLYDGATRHGSQGIGARLRGTPTSYYHRSGPAGQVFSALAGSDRLDRIAVVGLGAGTLAAYAPAGGQITFYEINPEIARIAGDERFFTYLRDCRAQVEVKIGDGRLELARVPDGHYGVIVLDAFSSDATPVHLMTREAVELYFRKLRPDGLLLAHLTNQHLDLEPVFHAIATALNLRGLATSDDVVSEEQALEGKNRSSWLVLARSRDALGALAPSSEWWPVPVESSGPPHPRFLWTDDSSSVLPLVRIW